MKLIKPKFEIIEQPSGLDGIYRMIEMAGRTCYKSEDKITEDSAKVFVDRMIKSGHGSMLEFGTVYLKKDVELDFDDCYGYICLDKDYVKYDKNKYSKVRYVVDTKIPWSTEGTAYITTNFRVLIQNGWMDDLKYLCDPTEFHEKRVCVRFTCDRGVSHEFVRHRVFSFAQESSRYCNYSKDKFGNEVTFIQPSWYSDNDVEFYSKYPESTSEFINDYTKKEADASASALFYDSCIIAEQNYLGLLKRYWKPQQARAVLPNALKTELVMTGFVSDWEHFFELRDDSHAHPDARALAHPLHEEFIKRGYIK